MHICIYIYIYIYTYVCIYTSLSLYIYIYIHIHDAAQHFAPAPSGRAQGHAHGVQHDLRDRVSESDLVYTII